MKVTASLKTNPKDEDPPMRSFPRTAATAAISTLIVLSVLSAPAQADDSQATPGVDSVDTDTSLAEGSNPSTPEEPAQDEIDASPSAAVDDPAESSAPSPGRTSTSDSGPAASVARLAAVFATQILSPVDSANVPEGSVAYSVQVATAGTYWLDLYCDQGYITRQYLDASSDGQQFSGSLGPVNAGEACPLDLYGSSGTGADVVNFTVERPVVVPEVRDPVARPDTFYPRVRDGFRDRTDIGFRTRGDSDVTVKIIDGSGSTVRTFIRGGRAWADYYERRWQTWNGRNRASNLVPTGRYTAVITSTLDGRSDTARVPIWVASGHRTVRETKTKDGW